MHNLLSDQNTYSVVKKDSSTKLEKTVNDLVKKWHVNGYISKQKFFSLRASDCPLPKAYGFPKIHKPNNPLRIIVSSVGTTLYPLAAFLQNILSDSIPQARGNVDNSFELCKMLMNKSILDSEVLISLDVTFLFTNVPLDLAIEGIVNRWEFISEKTKIPRDEFIFAVQVVLTSTFFTFNYSTYKQTSGVPMGSPLSPVIADIVMQDLESKVFHNLNIEFPFYVRYVDDIALAAPAEAVEKILNKFNGYHNRLRFTIKREKKRSLNFLDTSIKVIDNMISIDWFKKTPSQEGTCPIFHTIQLVKK